MLVGQEPEPQERQLLAGSLVHVTRPYRGNRYPITLQTQERSAKLHNHVGRRNAVLVEQQYCIRAQRPRLRDSHVVRGGYTNIFIQEQKFEGARFPDATQPRVLVDRPVVHDDDSVDLWRNRIEQR
jgi:hypothetical protein